MRLVLADDSWMFAPVSGTTDSEYVNTWLTNGDPYRAVKKTGTLSLTVTPAVPVSVDLYAVINHTIEQAATITIGGSLSQGISTAAWPRNRIPRNWYRRLTTPVSVSTASITVSGNGNPVYIGEFYGGLSHDVGEFLNNVETDPGQPFAWEMFKPPYDSGVNRPRRKSGQVILSAADFAIVEALELGSYNGTRPSLAVFDDAVNDVWLCNFSYKVKKNEGWFFCDFEFVEIPSVRWPA
jgi:hypothetical protein